MKKINVKKSGVKSDGLTLVSKEIQDIIDKASKEGIPVYFPRGKYLVSSLTLKNNTYIHLGWKAEIICAKDNELPVFYGENCKNITIVGRGSINVNSTNNKAIHLKECNDIYIGDIKINNALETALLIEGSSLLTIKDLTFKTSGSALILDNSKDCYVDGCEIETNKDAISIKSSYSLNKVLDVEKIIITNCNIKAEGDAIKVGEETIGNFNKIRIEGIKINKAKNAGISLLSVDGSNIESMLFSNVHMRNVGTPMFVHLGKRLNAREGTPIGSINNITFQNIMVRGPYKEKDFKQITSSVTGLKEKPLENIKFRNIIFELCGGVNEFNKEVIDEVPAPLIDEETNEPLEIDLTKEYASSDPKVNMFGDILPAMGIYFRHINGLDLNTVIIKTINEDKREMIVYDNVTNLKRNTVYEG